MEENIEIAMKINGIICSVFGGDTHQILVTCTSCGQNIFIPQVRKIIDIKEANFLECLSSDIKSDRAIIKERFNQFLKEFKGLCPSCLDQHLRSKGIIK